GPWPCTGCPAWTRPSARIVPSWRRFRTAIPTGRRRRCASTSTASSAPCAQCSDCMSSLPHSARAVVVGCGIVGSSVAYHLTLQGWSDVVLLDKGPLPNPGGSTGHASNFIYPVDHSKEMTFLTLESMRPYEEMGVLTQRHGIEV